MAVIWLNKAFNKMPAKVRALILMAALENREVPRAIIAMIRSHKSTVMFFNLL